MDRSKIQALEKRLVAFGVQVIRLAEALPESRAAKHLEGQMIRSGTAPALLYAEAQSAESRADFIHKMKIGLKELRETGVSLQMIQLMNWNNDAGVSAALKEDDELISIFVKSIHTASTK